MLHNLTKNQKQIENKKISQLEETKTLPQLKIRHVSCIYNLTSGGFQMTLH